MKLKTSAGKNKIESIKIRLVPDRQPEGFLSHTAGADGAPSHQSRVALQDKAKLL